MSDLWLTLVIVLAAILVALRISGLKGEAFQAVAHVFVGGVFAWAFKPPFDVALCCVGVAMSLAEVYAFFMKGHEHERIGTKEETGLASDRDLD